MLMLLLAWAVLIFHAPAHAAVFDETGVVKEGSTAAPLIQPFRQASPCPLRYFPVRGQHNTGYGRNERQGPAHWTCNSYQSNSDYVRRSCNDRNAHFGNDLFASQGTPVIATVAGKVAEAGYSSYSGWNVRIVDACGWSHWSIHLDSIAGEIEKEKSIRAGTIIGYVGKSGKASNKVVHLHYSIYPGPGEYCQGVDPWKDYLFAVEEQEGDVCYIPQVCGNINCGPKSYCLRPGKCCPTDRPAPGCPN